MARALPFAGFWFLVTLALSLVVFLLGCKGDPSDVPVRLIVVDAPGVVEAGENVTVTLEARDPFGMRLESYRGTVSIETSDPAASVPDEYAFTESDAGQAPLPAVVLRTTGTQEIRIVDSRDPEFLTRTIEVEVLPAKADMLVLAGLPSTEAVVGEPYSLTVTAYDEFGNHVTDYDGTVALQSDDVEAALPSPTAAVHGVVEFAEPLVFDSLGTFFVEAYDLNEPTLSVTQSVTVVAGEAVELELSGVVSPVGAGTAESVSVRAVDAHGFTADSYKGTVTFESSDPQALLPADVTFTPNDEGDVLVAGLEWRTAGTQWLRVTDVEEASLTDEQPGIIVEPAPASQLDVTGITSPIEVYESSDITLTARDEYGNVDTAYIGTVTLFSDDPHATLPANYTFLASDAGVVTWSDGVEFGSDGTFYVAAEDLAQSSISGAQTGIVVEPLPADEFELVGFPATVTAGEPHTLTVQVRDRLGGIVEDYTGTIEIDATSAGVLPASYTFTTSDEGERTFPGVELHDAGSQTITVTDINDTSLTGTHPVTVEAAEADRLRVEGVTNPIEVNESSSVVVTARDEFGNVDPSYTGTVSFSSDDSQALLPGDTTFQSSDAGTVTLSDAVEFGSVGTFYVAAEDVAEPSMSGEQTGIVVVPRSASQIEIIYPSTVEAGEFNSLTIRMLDSQGNVATGYTGTVDLQLTTSSNLPSSYTLTSADNGEHTFGVTLVYDAGSHSITVTDVNDPSLTETEPFDVEPGPATEILVDIQNDPMDAGTTNQASMEVVDHWDNRVTDYTETVSFDTSDDQAPPISDYTFTLADAGVATIPFELRTAGTQWVQVDDGVIDGVDSVEVLGLSTTHGFVLETLVQARFGEPFEVTVRAVDVYGNHTDGYTGTVAFASSDTAATLPSPVSMNASDQGVVEVPGFVLDTLGTQTIEATDANDATLTGSVLVEVGQIPSPFDMADVDGTLGVSLHGTSQSDSVGESISGAGDVNGSGYADVLVANEVAINDYEAYLVFGRSKSDWQSTGGNFDYNNFDGTDGVRLYSQSDSLAGRVVAGVGDVNGNGFDDVALIGTGVVYVVFGRSISDWSATNGSLNVDLLNGTTGVELTGMSPWSTNHPRSIAGAGDVNGSGYDDLLVTGSAGLFIVFGKTASDWSAGGSTLNVSNSLDGITAFRIDANPIGFSWGIRFRNWCAGLGDINGNGYADIAITGEDNFRQGAYLIFGRPQSEWQSHGGTQQINDTTLDGSDFAFVEGHDRNDDFLAPVGDVNGNGYADLLLRRDEETMQVTFGRDAAQWDSLVDGRLVFGNWAFGTDFLPGTDGFLIKAPAGGFFFDGAGVGDFNGNGHADLLLQHGSSSNRGGYVLFGRSSWPSTFELDPANPADTANLYREVSSSVFVSAAGDTNGNARGDVMLALPGDSEPNGSTSTGRVFLIFGLDMSDPDATVTSVERPGDFREYAAGVLGNGSNASSPRVCAWLDWHDGHGPGSATALSQTDVRYIEGLAGVSPPSGMSPSDLADVRWHIETDRVNATQLSVTLRYTEDAIAGLNLATLRLWRADDENGPWSEITGITVDQTRRTVTATISPSDLGHFILSD